jgi:two-component system OmpR family response regulator
VRILLIDDDEAVLETVSLMLASEGHSVLAVASGADGIARLEAGEPIDLVLTDLHMPGMNGWEIVRTVRSRWPAVRVGLNSGSLDELPVRHERLDVIIRKPVNFAELRAAISELPARP